MDITEKLMNLSAKVLLCTDRQELLKLSAELNFIANETIELTKKEKPKEKESCISGFLTFTKKELSKMKNKTFKKELILNGLTCHLTRRPRGKKTYCFEIRYRRNGFNISAAGNTIEKAKEKFYEKSDQAITDSITEKEKIYLFPTVAEEWFSTKQNNCAGTLKAYRFYYERYILPKLKKSKINEIRTAELQAIANSVKDRGRVYEDVRSIMNQVFTYAVYNGIIMRNPVKLVQFIRHERQNGKALSKSDEKDFLKNIIEHKYKTSFHLILFFGLRPCELDDVRIDGDFIIARNRKRKNGKIEYKKIPISPQAKKYMNFSKPLNIFKVTYLDGIFKKLCPNNKLYDLRHTFASRTQEFVRQEIVEVWLGDSSQKLIANTYTHYSNEHMLTEMRKVDY